MKAFISYSIQDKKHGAAVKAALEEINIESFLAHNDLRVSEEWKERILAELKECEIFVPLLSAAFKTSDWCGQETGIVVERNKVLVIPLSLDGTLPYGFISHLQCHRIPPSGIDPQTILTAVAKKWPSIVIEALLDNVDKNANSFRHAEAVVAPFVPYFKKLSRNQAIRFAQMAVNNNQIWRAGLCCSEYLPQFLKLNKTKIPQSLHRRLKYQIENQRVYESK